MNLSDRIYLSIYLSLYLSTTTALGRFCDQFLNALDGFYKGRSSRRVLPGPLQVTTLVTTFFQRGATLYETTRAAPNLLRLVQEGMSTAASCASGDIYAGGPRPAKRLLGYSVSSPNIPLYHLELMEVQLRRCGPRLGAPKAQWGHFRPLGGDEPEDPIRGLSYARYHPHSEG